MRSSRLTPFLCPPGGRRVLISLLHNAAQALLQRLDGLLRGGVACQSVVELRLHLERHIPIEFRHGPRRDVIEKNVLGQLDYRRRLLHIGVVQDRLSGRYVAALDSPELEALIARHELDELPRLIRHIGLGVDHKGPPAEGAGALVARGHRYRCDPDLILLYLAAATSYVPIHSRPLPEEHRLAVFEERVPFRLCVVGHGLGRCAARDHAAIRLEAGRRLGAVYDNFTARYVGEDIAAVGPDVLQSVAYPALVIRALEEEAVFGARVLRGLDGHLLELVPGLGGRGVAGLLEEIDAGVEQPRVFEPRYRIDSVLVDAGIYGSGQELVLLRLGEIVGEVLDPALRGELDRPDDVAPDDVYVAAPGLELGPDLVEILPRIGGHRADGDLELALVLLVELVYQLGIGLARVVGTHGEDNVTRAPTPSAAARSTEQRCTCKPRAAQLQEVAAVDPPPSAYSRSVVSLRHAQLALSTPTQHVTVLTDSYLVRTRRRSPTSLEDRLLGLGVEELHLAPVDNHAPLLTFFRVALSRHPC